MELFEAIKKRHSYRGGFTDKGIPREDLQKIVQTGLEAPSGKNCQTTRFVIVDEPSLLEQIGQMHPGNKAVQQAKAMIACIIDTNPEAIYEGFEFQVEDCAAGTGRADQTGHDNRQILPARYLQGADGSQTRRGQVAASDRRDVTGERHSRCSI